MSLVPAPPGNATTRSGCSASSISRFRVSSWSSGRRTSHLEDLRVVNEAGDEVINWSVAWSVDDRTGRPTEVFIHNTGKPGSLQDGLDQLGRMISKIIQGRWPDETQPDC